jgi:hypothetical protein
MRNSFVDDRLYVYQFLNDLFKTINLRFGREKYTLFWINRLPEIIRKEDETCRLEGRL